MFEYIHGSTLKPNRTYSTEEAATALGISKSTLLRWLRERRFKDVKRDRNNWRIFTDDDLARIQRAVDND